MICNLSGKQCYSRGDALRKMHELLPDDPDRDRLNVYRCAYCDRHHVGHKREPGDTTSPARRLNR